jgi:hypothetical protein
MLTEKQVAEILYALNQLPSEKLEEARDFILLAYHANQAQKRC